MKVLLVVPRSNDLLHNPSIPLGLVSIGTYLKRYQHEVKIIDMDVKILFYQAGSRDIMFSIYPKVYNKEFNLEITKDDDYLLYNLVNKLYDSITTKKFLDYPEDRVDSFDFKDLYDGEKITWKSDAPVNENSYNEEFKYNYLNIYKENEKYIFKFINNSVMNCYTIEFNTDRSRYERFVYPFIIFFNDLEKIIEPYRQIDIDEYLHYEKIKKKKRG